MAEINCFAPRAVISPPQERLILIRIPTGKEKKCRKPSPQFLPPPPPTAGVNEHPAWRRGGGRTFPTAALILHLNELPPAGAAAASRSHSTIPLRSF